MSTLCCRILLLALLFGVTSGTAVLRAETVFPDGFESGTLCAWSATLGGECTCFDAGLGQLRAQVKPAPGQLKIGEWLPQPLLAPEILAEWFEVRALAPVDLNGLQAGVSALGGTPILAYGGNCLRLDPAGDPSGSLGSQWRQRAERIAAAGRCRLHFQPGECQQRVAAGRRWCASRLTQLGDIDLR